MKIIRISSLLLVALMLLGGAVSAQVVDEVVIDGAYVRAVPPGQPNSAAFMKVSNKGGAAHALVAGSSPAAAVVELHTHTMEDGMMRMRQVEKIDLPAGETVSLEPGGLHVMLIGLQQKLAPEKTIPLTLRFEDGSEVSLQVPVRKLQMRMKPADHGQMSH
ncbi:MAG: copper chaperone PCu(A)C [Chromatiales bacterium]|jgi:copper(I)-binding protein